MKRFLLPLAAFAAGLILIVVLMPQFNAAQPPGIRLTRADATKIADAEAARMGIPVDKAWPSLSWSDSPLIAKELESKPDLRRRANDDPVLGPRLGSYKRNYYRRGVEKFQPYGYVVVHHRTGAILAERRPMKVDEPGAQATEAQLRPRADAFVRSRNFPGAPSPKFEGARPNVLRSRTDWVFRYRVHTDFPLGNVVPYLNVYFTGDKLAGWALIEEYADGSPFRGPTLLQLEGTADNSSSVSGIVDGTTVAGTITASPALAVSVGFGIWPSNSIAQGASYQLAAGSTSGTFSLTVPAGTAVSRAEAMQILRQRR